MIVSVKTVRRPLALGKALEFCAVHQEDVGPTVIVIIEDGNSVSGGLDNVFLGIETAENVLRSETGLISDVREVCNGSGGSCSRFCLLCG